MIEPVVAHSGTVPRQTRSLMYQCNPLLGYHINFFAAEQVF